jgi:hypothetical protein
MDGAKIIIRQITADFQLGVPLAAVRWATGPPNITTDLQHLTSVIFI